MNILTTTPKTGFAPLPAGIRELDLQDATLVVGGKKGVIGFLLGLFGGGKKQKQEQQQEQSAGVTQTCPAPIVINIHCDGKGACDFGSK